MSSLEPFMYQLNFQILPWHLLLKTLEPNYEDCHLQQCFASKNGNEADCKRKAIANAV